MGYFGDHWSLSSGLRAAVTRTCRDLAIEDALLELRCSRICSVLLCSRLDAADVYVDIFDLVQDKTSSLDIRTRKAMLDEAWRLWSIVALDERRGVVAGFQAIDHWLRSPLSFGE
jgi:hypothetical protein